MERPDRRGEHRTAFLKNSRRILETQDCCGICGKPVDKSLKYPNPMAPSVDHIIPVARGGHPSDISNLQLAHWSCNRAKSDHFLKEQKETSAKAAVTSNRNLPHTRDWSTYSA